MDFEHTRVSYCLQAAFVAFVHFADESGRREIRIFQPKLLRGRKLQERMAMRSTVVRKMMRAAESAVVYVKAYTREERRLSERRWNICDRIFEEKGGKRNCHLWLKIGRQGERYRFVPAWLGGQCCIDIAQDFKKASWWIWEL